MIWIDYAIIIIIIFSCLIGSFRGFVHEVLSLIILSCAFFISKYYYIYLSDWFINIENKLVRNGIAIVILFITTLFVGIIFDYAIGKIIKKIGLSGVDKVLGVFFGVLRGILIIVIMLFFLNSFTELLKEEDWKNSQFIQKFYFLIRWFFDYLKSYPFFRTEWKFCSLIQDFIIRLNV